MLVPVLSLNIPSLVRYGYCLIKMFADLHIAKEPSDLYPA